MKNQILAHLSTECPWRDTLYWYDTIDSTNTEAKRLAKAGAAHGTVLIAGNQTAGRGRMGRSFSSPGGQGVYLSVILRPACSADQLMHLTCAAAVAGSNAVAKAADFTPSIKWTNDLVWQKKKLGGILTELSFDNTTGLVEYAVIGIGINCTQKNDDFPPELQDIATSVSQITGCDCSPALLAARLTEALYAMDQQILYKKAEIMLLYRSRCITLGQAVSIVRGDEIRHAIALDLDDDGGLIVRLTDGQITTVTSGEVSVRGMYGYL